MLRRTQGLRVTGRHTAPTPPKYADLPGIWGPRGGPPKDTAARRFDFYRLVLMHKIGKLTAPFKTERVKWMWRKLQMRLWKGSVLVIVSLSALLIGNMIIIMLYQAYSVGPSTPVLERKAREHRVSKQIVQMVRQTEKDLTQEQDRAEAALVVQANKAAAEAKK